MMVGVRMGIVISLRICPSLAPQAYAATPTYAIYLNGFKNSKWGMASAQSVILLLITVGLSILKRKVEKQQ